MESVPVPFLKKRLSTLYSGNVSRVWNETKLKYKIYPKRRTSSLDMSCITATLKQNVKIVIDCAIFHPGVSSLTRHVKKNFISAQASHHPSFTSHLATALCVLPFLLAGNCASGL